MTLALAAMTSLLVPSTAQAAAPKNGFEYLKDADGKWGERKDVFSRIPDNLKKYFPTLKSDEYELAGFFWHQG